MKTPSRPPYVHADAPTTVFPLPGGEHPDHTHVWTKGRVEVFERIPHRFWSCECGAVGTSIELIPKEPS